MQKTITIKPIHVVIATSVLVIGYFIVKKTFSKPKGTLKSEAKKDLDFWKNKTETDSSASDTLVSYWKTVGSNFTPTKMQSSSFHKSMPWSSAYVSDLMKRSGFTTFKSSPSHAGYTVDAIKNRKNKKNNSFWAYNPEETKKIEIGDVLVAGRSGSNPSLDTIAVGMPTHGSVVINISNIKGKEVATVIGGNVSNKVKTTQVPLTNNHTLVDGSDIFAHLKHVK